MLAPPTTPPTTSALAVHAWVLPLGVAAGAWAVSLVVPLLSALLVALLVGALWANTPARAWLRAAALENASRVLLRCGIALLGLRLGLADVAALGWFGALVVVATLTLTFWGTVFLGRRLGLASELTYLIAAGFSICGAAAIAGVQDAVQAARHQVAIAVGLVTVYGTATLVFIPFAGDALGLSHAETAVWAGASIHEVAQVVAAAALIGGGGSVLAVAMSVKLGRVLLLVPVHRWVARQTQGQTQTRGRGAGVPWFLWAFVAAVALRATGLLPGPVVTGAQAVSTICLAAGMFGLGLGLVLGDLLRVPACAVVLATLATAIGTVVPLALILLRR